MRRLPVKVFEGFDKRTECLARGRGCVQPGAKREPANKPGGGGNFEFIIPPGGDSQYFAVETAKGACGAGVQQDINLIYKPPQDTSLTVGGYSLNLLADAGQWVTTDVKLVLSGGFVPPGSPPTQEFIVRLKGYLRQV